MNNSQSPAKGDSYMRIPVDKSTWVSFKDFIYNSSSGTVLGKSRKQWGITGLFYLVFFSVLAILFAICMLGLMATLSRKKPRWILDESLIGTSPGLGFRPSPQYPDQALISYDASNSSDVEVWVKQLDKFLEYYMDPSKLPNGGKDQKTCTYNQHVRSAGKVCEVDTNNWGPCSPDNRYGYFNSSPCIFIKLNKIFGWKPEYYSKNNLPLEMPSYLTKQINELENPHLNTVWVHCQGEHASDQANIGEINYFSSIYKDVNRTTPRINGFPGYYFPYENDSEFLSPLVAVQFVRPNLTVAINVECYAWAKNIKHDRKTKEGMVYFQLKIN